MRNALRQLGLTLAMTAAFGAVAGGQAVSRVTPPPDRTAAGMPWYASRAPLFVDGGVYEAAGASVFFNANTMVPVTTFDGVEIYEDTTLEPHSVVYVPIGRGLMQPYERRRTGDLAGTTGSRAPSFPVGSIGETRETPGVLTDEDVRLESAPSPSSAPASDEPCVPREGLQARRPEPPVGPMRTVRAPSGNRGIWIPFEGLVWIGDGRAERHDADAFVKDGEYAAFPVYRRAGDPSRIYVPAADGFLAPYRRTPDQP
jgi:hypothetical protein